MTMNTILAIASIVIVAFIITWYKDSRVFLYFWYKAVFYKRTNPPYLNTLKNELFPESFMLEQNWMQIKAELKNYINGNAAIPKFHEMDPAQHKISFDKGPAWRTLLLKAYGVWIEQNCEKFPYTRKLLSQCSSVPTALFSILEPGAVIPPHEGQLKGILRYHLAMEVPKSGLCFLSLAGEPYSWKEGEGVLFDDTYPHEVRNISDEYRIVLFMDVKRRLPRLFRLPDMLFHWLAVVSPKFRQARMTGKIKIDL
jgi:aspartyl/asparaginyl beta-hydroxylase (cupin superfamily)